VDVLEAAPGDASQAPHVLREYALIADGERGALVGPRGDICWMCAPRWHSDGVFNALIGGEGSFAVSPVERCVWGGHYEEGTLIWRGRWVTDSGVVECRDALARPAARGVAVLLRRVIAREGDARMRIMLDASAGFGRHAMTDLALEDGVWRGRSGPLHLRLQGAERAHTTASPAGRHAVAFDLVVAAGATHDVVLEIAVDPLAGDAPRPQALWAATQAAWSADVPRLPEAIGERDARHACAVLHGLTSADGGMVAAATLGLPERARQGRNYDYRYAWIRDQCYAGLAAAAAGRDPLLDSAVHFVSERLLADGPGLKPAYTVDGKPVPDERELPLPGYPGGTAITGNWVNGQFQLDAFGEALLLLGAAARRGRLDADGHRALVTAADAVRRRWREPDAGIWEIEPRDWAHSRLICAAGLTAAAEADPGAAAVWTDLAGTIVADTARHSLHGSGRWQRAPDDPRVDASLLLPVIRGALAADDPRSTATLRAVRADLSEDGYVYRFRPDERPLGEAEGAFLLCGFVTALAEHDAGDRVRALRRIERTRAACGPPGLYSEEWDVAQRQMRGNLPQAFVHALLLECAVRLGGPPG
jgi:alpha,alpha-trehalase